MLIKHLHSLTKLLCIDFAINHLSTLKDVPYCIGMPCYSKHNLNHIHLEHL